MYAELVVYKIVEDPAEAARIKALLLAKNIFVIVEQQPGNPHGLGTAQEYCIKITEGAFGDADRLLGPSSK